MKFQSLGSYFLGTVCCLLASCAAVGPSVSVKTDYNHKISFAGYHTYALDMGESGLHATGQAALADALKTNLAAKGINEAPRGQADLVVVPVVFTQEKLHSMPTGGSTYVLSHPGYRGGDWYINNDVTQYTEGTLVLDFLDRQKHLIVFRGIAQGAVTTSERNAIAIREAVQRIVADLPK
jgi:hypothetical protein